EGRDTHGQDFALGVYSSVERLRSDCLERYGAGLYRRSARQTDSDTLRPYRRSNDSSVRSARGDDPSQSRLLAVHAARLSDRSPMYDGNKRRYCGLTRRRNSESIIGGVKSEVGNL